MGDTTRLRRSSDSLPDPKPPQWGLEFFRPARVPVARTREREPRAARSRIPRGRGVGGRPALPSPTRPGNPTTRAGSPRAAGPPPLGVTTEPIPWGLPLALHSLYHRAGPEPTAVRSPAPGENTCRIYRCSLQQYVREGFYLYRSFDDEKSL